MCDRKIQYRVVWSIEVLIKVDPQIWQLRPNNTFCSNDDDDDRHRDDGDDDDDDGGDYDDDGSGGDKEMEGASFLLIFVWYNLAFVKTYPYVYEITK